MGYIQYVRRLLNGQPAGYSTVVHARSAAPRLSNEAREENYRRQNRGRPLTVAQRRQLRRQARRG